MKNNPVVAHAVRTEHSIKALPKLTVEWNLNRYTVPSVFNSLDEDEHGMDLDIFPLESIVEPSRPSSKGINKALLRMTMVSDPYWTPHQPRFYLGGEDDIYKYWVSPQESDAQGNIQWCSPTVIYDRTVSVSKLHVKFENSWATPVDFTMQFTTDGGTTWLTAAHTPPVAPTGDAYAYFTGPSTGWSHNKPDALHTQQINGVRVLVHRLGPGIRPDGSITHVKTQWGVVPTNGLYCHCAVIEVSGRLEADLSDYVISVSDTFDAANADQVNPVGTISSNVADIVLWNEDEQFSPENSQSPYHGLLDANAEFNLSYVYHLDGQTYPVQQFKLFSDSWAEQDDKTVQVSLTDGSKYLKEVKPLAAKYEDLTFSQIVYRICDAVGFTDYVLFDDPLTIDYKIPVFWTDGDKTAWELFDELSTATQSLLYFDAYGRLNVKTREDAFNPYQGSQWTLRAHRNGSELPDIISCNQVGEYEANVVKVVYKTTKWAGENNGFVEYSTVWEPEDTTVVRSTPLYRDLDVAGTVMHLGGDAATWPYEGHALIDGEVVKFHGKDFRYVTTNGFLATRTIMDEDEFHKYNSITTSNQRYRNHFTGDIRIVERGAWDTEPVTHWAGILGYNIRRAGGSGNFSGNAGLDYNRGESTISLSSGGRLKTNSDFLYATRGNPADTGWRHFGTKFRINDDNQGGSRAGIVFNQSGQRDGYYVEVCTSLSIPENNNNRKEVALYTIGGNNLNDVIAQGGMPIVSGRWHTLDIFFGWDNHKVSVWIDGKRVFTTNIPGNQRLGIGGRFGMFARGNTSASFDYLYAIARRRAGEPEDDFSSYHALEGWSRGRTKEDWAFKKRKGVRKVRGKKRRGPYRKNEQFMDEFGPYVHEIREFDVKFDPAPVAHSDIFMTNDQDAYLLDFNANSFGASFAVANTARRHVVIHGDDALAVPGSDNPVNHRLLVYGRALVFEEEDEVVVEDTLRKRARGEIVTEINSDWIQSKEAAEAVANWIASHWSGLSEELSVEVFGNTMFEIGDLVSIDYPEKKMTPTSHQYYITGINTNFDAGIRTELTLRRKN